MKNIKCPIISYCTGSDEFTTPEKFASHVPQQFSKVNEIKSKGIHRCYIIFYDNPDDNEFLKDLPVVYLLHAASTITKVFEYKNSLIAISPLGGPSAGLLMEEVSVFGINEFIAIGSSGCLEPSVQDKFLLVDKAIRDEGLSYHYLKPSTYVSTNKQLSKEVQEFLKSRDFKFIKGITWTTDAYYRETKQKINMAKSLGAVCVEMECASWCAVAQFRKFKFAQVLYFSDLVQQEAWTRLVEMNGNYGSAMNDASVMIVKEMIDEYSAMCNK